MQDLLDKIRPVTENDKNLPTFSYSKIDTYKKCAMRYKIKYHDKKFTNDTTLPLELGSLNHYVLEQKGKMIVLSKCVDYDKLNNILENGVEITDDKTKEKMPGLKVLRKKYFEEWFTPDNASGMNYKEKMEIFDKVLHKEMEDTEWVPTYFEMPFEFVWDNKVIIKGFIDRIDTKNQAYRTVDYKTSKKIYEQKELATSLQFGIYALAILNEFGVLPEESIYRFILIDDTQYALTKGWEKRLIKSMDKVFQQIALSEKENKYPPSPTPLCHWCNYCQHNPDAKEFQHECEYFSLWQPDKKSFEVNKKWNPTEANNNTTKRKLIF